MFPGMTPEMMAAFAADPETALLQMMGSMLKMLPDDSLRGFCALVQGEMVERGIEILDI